MSASAQTVIVRPRRNRDELIFLALATVVIIATAAAFILLRPKDDAATPLRSYQISAFSQMNRDALGLFMDLYTSAYDVEMYHRNNSEAWPDVATLENNLVPPFAVDEARANRGKFVWTFLNLDKDNVHRAVYIGHAEESSPCGSFILFMEHYHTPDGAYFFGINRKTPFNIWYLEKGFALPKDFSEGTLISAGWREAVPFKGNDELKRLGRK